MASNFKIGTTSGGITSLDSLSTPIEDPKSSFMPYARTVNLGSGGQRGTGSPVVVWEFALLELEQRNQLKSFCTGASANVYIRTKLNDDTFAVYQCNMLWPSGIEDRWYGVKKSFPITFRNLVAV